MGRPFKDKSTIWRKKKTQKSVDNEIPPVTCEEENADRKPDLSESQKETAKQFALLARTMEDHFSLPRLLDMAKVNDLKDPHINLNLLLKTKIIIPDGSGYFVWDSDVFEKITSC
ncbi:MAG: hypothetical protein L3J69_04725 [Desulfobacula sp.]|nr:hypothetical protein [Desulfobacula sp.]